MRAWNKGLIGEDYKKHFKNGFSGTFKKGQIPHNKGRPQSEWMSREGYKLKEEMVMKEIGGDTRV